MSFVHFCVVFIFILLDLRTVHYKTHGMVLAGVKHMSYCDKKGALEESHVALFGIRTLKLKMQA